MLESETAAHSSDAADTPFFCKTALEIGAAFVRQEPTAVTDGLSQVNLVGDHVVLADIPRRTHGLGRSTLHHGLREVWRRAQ